MSSPLMTDNVSPMDTSQAREPARLLRILGSIVGWTWRFLVGMILCFSAPGLSWLTSILVVGWFQRWVRGRILFAWWKSSPVRESVPFSELGEIRRDGSPVLLPRWFLPENRWPRLALWLNFKEGLTTLICVYLLIGFSCLIMLYTWERGWHFFLDPDTGSPFISALAIWLGVLPFMVGFLYIPLARIHAAVVGEARAFFDARVVWQIIWARPAAFTGLVLLVVLMSLPLDFMKMAPLWLHREEATDAEVRVALWEHLRTTAFMLFWALLVVYSCAARVYSNGLYAALRQGRLSPADLGPQLYLILKQLELVPAQAEAKQGFARILRWTWRWYSYRVLFLAMLLLSFIFVFMRYLTEAMVAHPFVGFMNHPLLQFPSVDYFPRHLLP